MLERDGERYQFAPRECLHGCKGSAGNLIPPDEFHTLRNSDTDRIAISVHVYQRVMERSHVFQPIDDAPRWYARECRELGLDT